MYTILVKGQIHPRSAFPIGHIVDGVTGLVDLMLSTTFDQTHPNNGAELAVPLSGA